MILPLCTSPELHKRYSWVQVRAVKSPSIQSRTGTKWLVSVSKFEVDICIAQDCGTMMRSRLLEACWLLFAVIPIVGVCNCSMFCFTLLYFHSCFAIILLGKRELVACLVCLPGVSWWFSGSSSRCHGFVCGLWLWYFWSYSLTIIYGLGTMQTTFISKANTAKKKRRAKCIGIKGGGVIERWC